MNLEQQNACYYNNNNNNNQICKAPECQKTSVALLKGHPLTINHT